ncbi:MAG: dTDP-4-amino-4,6-dideoxygalactose transaminase [Flavobacteriales bacterium]|jgi:dTDP-4-amino-4,6-dideoxygalactose transaminase
MNDIIPFQKPYFTGTEIKALQASLTNKKLSADGQFTNICQTFLNSNFNYRESLLTHSCTAALEIAALSIKIEPGDEVIMPSYTFVSTANAFALRGAKIVFADCKSDLPNIDETKIEALISPNTKAIVVVHYAGIACEMDALISICKKHNLVLIEDAAHAIGATYKGAFLGSFGDISTLSFHETKNISCGEGGALIINNKNFSDTCHQIREEGTNKLDFLKGRVREYEWVNLGSSYAPSELNAAVLSEQLLHLDHVLNSRIKIWRKYHSALSPLEHLRHIALPSVPEFSEHNSHIFYIVCSSLSTRNKLMEFLKNNMIQVCFHYQPLHLSPFFTQNHQKVELTNTQKFSDGLIRLPLYPGLTDAELEFIVAKIFNFFRCSYT